MLSHFSNSCPRRRHSNGQTNTSRPFFILSKSYPNEETLYLYLVVSNEALSETLIQETLEGKKPVYITSKALQGSEVRYQQIVKVAMTLINTVRRLRYYFLAHTIIVKTDQPIK